MKNEDIERLIEANELIEAVKSAILCNTIITIRDDDTNEFLWSCQTGESYGFMKDKKLKIDQDINMFAVLKEFKNALKNKK